MPLLFDTDAPGVALKPSPAAIKRCMALLSDNQKVGDQEVATGDVFKAPDAFGWAYQYWNTEEKDRVFEKVRTQKGAKIEGADIVPATQAGFDREPSVAWVLRRFGQAMEHIDELGSLARPDEELRAIVHEEHATWERQVAQKQEANFPFPEMAEDKLRGQLPFHEISDDEFGERMLYRARAAIHAFTE